MKPNDAISFWKKVDRRGTDECWPWIGKCKSANGYGRLDIWGQEGVYAQRVAYLIANPGSIALRAPARNEYGFIRHSCDNPPCCNPKHLLLGTHDDNMRDKVVRGRSRWFDSTVDSPRAKLTAHDVRMLRLQKSQGATDTALSMLYEISKCSVNSAYSGRTYADIT